MVSHRLKVGIDEKSVICLLFVDLRQEAEVRAFPQSDVFVVLGQLTANLFVEPGVVADRSGSSRRSLLPVVLDQLLCTVGPFIGSFRLLARYTFVDHATGKRVGRQKNRQKREARELHVEVQAKGLDRDGTGAVGYSLRGDMRQEDNVLIALRCERKAHQASYMRS